MSARKTLARLTLILVALATALFAVRTALDYSSGKRLEKFLAQAKAGGLPVTRADLGPVCPRPANAYPLWKAAVALYDNDYRARTNLTEELTKIFDGRSLDEEARSVIRAAIDANRRPIDLLLESADRPCFRITDGGDFPSLNVAALMGLIRLIGFDSLFRVEAGDLEGGLKEWRDGYRLARLMAQEPSLITALIGISNARSLLAVFNSLITGRPFDEKAVTAVLADLNASFWRFAVAATMKGERVLCVASGAAILEGRPEALEDGWKSRFLLFWAKPWVRREIMSQYSAFDDIERLLEMPYFQSRAPLNAFDDRQRRRRWYERLIDEGMTGGAGISSTGLKLAALEALVDTARVGLAARLFHLREKHLPSAVAELVPSLLSHEPLDPFTGKPFVFRAAGSDLLIYSLGSNEKDDEGLGTFQITQMVQKSRDDWAWRDVIR